MEKRGVSHIEVILAFLLFIAAIIAAFYFFNPGNNTRIVNSFISYAEKAVEDQSKINLEVYSVKINRGIIPSGEGRIAVVLDSIGEGEGARVETYRGEKLSSGVSGNQVSFDRGNNDFVYIKVGNEFSRDEFGTSISNPSYYGIISQESQSIISEKKVGEMKERYDSNYEGLKKELNLPGRMDFSYSLTFTDGSKIEASKNIPSGVEVYSEIKREEVLRESGKSEFADLMIKVW